MKTHATCALLVIAALLLPLAVVVATIEPDVPPPPYEDPPPPYEENVAPPTPPVDKEKPPPLPEYEGEQAPPLPDEPAPPLPDYEETPPPLPEYQEPDRSKTYDSQRVRPHDNGKPRRPQYESYKVVQEVQEVSLGQNLVGAANTWVAGVVLLVLATLLLWWNEGRSVRDAGKWAKAMRMAVSVEARSLSAEHIGQLVHTVGHASAIGSPLEDRECKLVVPNAIQLRRVVEVYQWRQKADTATQKNLGGSSTKTTTYSCHKVWSETVESSEGYKSRPTPPNPHRKHLENMKIAADTVLLEDKAQLSVSQIASINAWSDVPVSDASMDAMAKISGKVVSRTGISSFYLGDDPSHPQIGDHRVTFSAVSPCIVSVVTGLRQPKKSGAALQCEPVLVEGSQVSLLSVGRHSKIDMLRGAASGSTVMTFLLRGLGFVLLYLSLDFMGAPLVAVANVVPFVGSVVGWALGWSAMLVAFLMWLLIVAVAWLYYRPLYGVTLLLAAAGLFYYLQSQQQMHEAPGQ